jgi:glycosyltransferase involved in cell wall biosynthesis
MNNNLKFSVITPSYNQGLFLDRCINSVLEQCYLNFEHIIIDGNSTDQTKSVLLSHNHTIWKSETDNGQTDALNKGLKMAEGDIIAWLNCDDMYCKNVFKIISQWFQNNPKEKIVIGDCFFYYNDTSKNQIVKNYERNFEDLLRYWDIWTPPTQPSIFFKKELLDEFGLFDESLHYAMDYEFWLRVSQKYKIRYIPELLSIYQFHDNSKSGTGTDWSKFYPEWHKSYLRYKKNSKKIPNSPLVTYVFLHHAKINIDFLEDIFDKLFSMRMQDFEIMIISKNIDVKKTLTRHYDKSNINIFSTNSFTAKNILQAILLNAKGLAYIFPEKNIEENCRALCDGVTTMLNFDDISQYEIKNNSGKIFTQSNNFLKHDVLYRKSRIYI